LDPERKPSADTVRDHLANERTLLSWVRLAIAITALGFVVARFGLYVAELLAAQGVRAVRTGLSLPIGIALVLAGPVFAAFALQRFLTVEREIDLGQPRRHHGLIFVLIGLIVVGSLGLAVYLVVASLAVAPPTA
jgi:putative membrane protein